MRRTSLSARTMTALSESDLWLDRSASSRLMACSMTWSLSTPGSGCSAIPDRNSTQDEGFHMLTVSGR